MCYSHADVVRHYHIKCDEQNKYYISDRHRFNEITQLVEYHQHNGGGEEQSMSSDSLLACLQIPSVFLTAILSLYSLVLVYKSVHLSFLSVFFVLVIEVSFSLCY